MARRAAQRHPGGGGRTLRLVSTPLRAPPEPGSWCTVRFAAEDAMLIAEEAGGA